MTLRLTMVILAGVFFSGVSQDCFSGQKEDREAAMKAKAEAYKKFKAGVLEKKRLAEAREKDRQALYSKDEPKEPVKAKKIVKKEPKQTAKKVVAELEQTKKPIKKQFVGPMVMKDAGKKYTWTGRLGHEYIALDSADMGKKTKVIVLTTDEGKRVVFSPSSVIKHSLTGLDLNLQVGEEVTITGMASPRRVDDKPAQFVHEIKLFSKQSASMYDDL